MRHSVVKAVLGGVAGTIVMTGTLRFIAPMMLDRPMDIAAMIANMMGASWTLGLVAHLINGIVIFPLAYALVAYRVLPGPPIVRGILWGVFLWLAAESIVMPMAGAGFFSSQIGGVKAASAALAGHVMYGALLGVISGGDASDALEPEKPRARLFSV